MDYQEAIEWIYSTQNFGIKLGVEGPKKLISHYLAFPTAETKVAHIAGTNGKGSTCAILDSLAQASGIKSGLFTSPHLVDFRERIQVAGKMISKEETAAHLTALRELVKDWSHHPTFFELTLAVAMRHFRENECELIILETGMGGRLDATTAIPANVYGITPIALDHSEWLGDTIEKIAAEKAGIIVDSSPVFCAKQSPEAERILAIQANKMRSEFHVIQDPLEAYSLGLIGQHQKYNAAMALEIAHFLEFPMRYDNVKAGLESVRWPGRFEIINEEPLEVIDGAHNPHAAKLLRETWQQRYPTIQPIIIFGAVEEKDLNGIIEQIAQITDTIIFTPVDSPRSIQFDAFTKLTSIKGVNILKGLNLSESLLLAKKQNRATLLAGSLYLLGEYKALMQNQNYLPTHQ